MDQISWRKFFTLIIGCCMYMINMREGKFFILKQKYYQWDKNLRFFKHTSVECKYTTSHMHKTTTIQCVLLCNLDMTS